MKLNKLVIVMGLATAVLVGCYSSSISTDPTEISANAVEISGNAVKGALQNAIVVACGTAQTQCLTGDADTLEDLSEGTGVYEKLASTTTDDSGDYTLTLDFSYTGAVQLRTLATTYTTQICDYTGCDENENISGLELKTIVYVDSTNTDVTVPMNVLTTLATAAQIKIGISDDSDMFTDQSNEASEIVVSLLGLDTDTDIFTADISSATADELEGASSEEIALALVNASFGTVSTDDTDEDTLAESISEISDAVSLIVEHKIDGDGDEVADNSLSDATVEDAESVLADALDEMETEISTQADVENIVVEEVTLNDVDAIEATVDELVVDIFGETIDPTATGAGAGSTGGTGG